MMCTLRSQALLASDLLADGYQYVLTIRLLSDKLENRFSQYDIRVVADFWSVSGTQDYLKSPQVSPIIPEDILRISDNRHKITKRA